MSSKTVRFVTPPVFRYDPLEPKRSIRLLRILDSDRWDDPIALSLTTYPLSECAFPKYTALSYTWGTSGRNVEVSIDGSRAMITESLFEGLQHLRKTQQQRDDIGGFWWIDMLCINQDCIPERSHQVAMMRDIFQSASLVVAWLGTTNRLEYGTRANPNLQVPSRDSDRPYSLDHCFRRITNIGRHLARDILSRRYWGRVWIIQELCVARDVIIMSDSFCISWSNFRSYSKKSRQSAAADRFWDFNNPVDRLSVSDFRLLIPYNLVDLRDKIRNYGGQGNLASLLRFASQSEATNPRDRVYSLLGLANDASEEKIPLDYSLSPCAVYCAAIRLIHENIRSHRSGPISRSTTILSSRSHEPLVVEDERRSQCDGLSCGAWWCCLDLALLDS